MYLALIEAYGSACVTQIQHCRYSTACSNIGACMRKHVANQGRESHFNLAHTCFCPKDGT